MRGTATATVAASPAQVWAVVADHEGMSKWGPGIKATVIRGGELEHNGVGAQRRVQALPLAPAFVEEVTEFEPEQKLSYTAVSGIPFRNYAGTVELTPVGDDTEISWTVSADNHLPGVAKALASGLLFALTRQIKRRL